MPLCGAPDEYDTKLYARRRADSTCPKCRKRAKLPPLVQKVGLSVWERLRDEDENVTVSRKQGLRVVFLDMDGVLNSNAYFKLIHDRIAQGIHDESSLQQYASGMIDPETVQLLNKLVKATGAVIVISSSWRHAHPMTHISLMLRFRGFEGYVIGCTPELPRGFKTEAFAQFLDVTSDDMRERFKGIGCRGNEIQAWLDAVHVESFVILDDDSDMAHLNPYFVKTSVAEGLQEEHVEKAIAILLGN